MANFGIGIGAFADGLVRGMGIGEKLKRRMNEHEIETAQRNALEEARAARNSHIDEQANVLLEGGPEAPAAPTPEAGVQATPVATPNVQPTPGSSPSPTVSTSNTGSNGMLESGNINLNNRPRVKNADGSISTVRSMSVGFDGREYLIPTVSDDGRIMSEQEAIEQFKKTGRHLGAFETPDAATRYAKSLHDQQERMYVGTAGGAQPAASGLPQQTAPEQSQQAAPSAPVTERTIETPPPAAAPETNPAAAASVLGVSGKKPTREQARKMAEQSAPSVMEFFQKKGVPKVAEAFLAQGNIEKAEAWTKWAEDADGKRNMKTWAKAWSATQRGDVEGAANHVFDLYKGMDDGTTPVSKEVVKDKAGNVTGFNVKLRDDATGEERSTFVDRDSLLNMGLTALAPPQMFEMAYKQKMAADKAKADAQAEAGKLQMQTAKEIAVERARQGGRVELEGIKAQNENTRDATRHENDLERDTYKSRLDAQNQRNKVQQELEAKVGALQKVGYSEEFIKNALPDILGVNQYKKTTSPEEAKRLAMSDRMKSDPTFARKTPDQQRQIIENDMALIYGGIKPTDAPPGAPADPAASKNPAAKGLPVLDTRTGKVIYR